MSDTTTIDEREPRADRPIDGPVAPEPGREPVTPVMREDPATPRPRDPSPSQPSDPGPDIRASATPSGEGTRAPLFDQGATGNLRTRWSDVQAQFVDEPRAAVEQADALVGEVMQRLADTFAGERQSLEAQWSRGDDVSTEDLRLALQRYRSFFDRLLSL